MRLRLLLFVAFLLQACASAATAHNPQSFLSVREDWGRYFQAAGVEGTLVLMKEGSGKMEVYNASRARTGYLPASTFKVLNSLIALETGVAGPETVFLWDGKQHPVAAWNKDLTLREAFAASSVPVYQTIARSVGQERMSRSVEAVKYGNADIGGGVDTFWLEGNLRISAVEQVDFLQRLYRDQLPFSKKTMAVVKDIMAQDKGTDWVIRSKSGWAARVSPNIGWWVGWLERKGEVWFFALNIGMAKPEQAKVRKEVVMAVLQGEGLLQ